MVFSLSLQLCNVSFYLTTFEFLLNLFYRFFQYYGVFTEIFFFIKSFSTMEYLLKFSFFSREFSFRLCSSSDLYDTVLFCFVCFVLFVFPVLFRAVPIAYGGSQTGGLIEAVAAGLRHSSRQHQILNPLSKARDPTCSLMVPSQIRFRCATTGTPTVYFKHFPRAIIKWAAL